MTDRHPDVEILDRRTAYQGIFRLDLYRVRHRLHDGGWSRPLVREIFERGHGAALLPYDPVADAVVLIEQFRIGALLGGLPPWQIEIPAGIIDAGEAAGAVARREAQEEAGCSVDRLEAIGRFALSPGAVTETVALFCGRVDSRGLSGTIHGLAAEAEDIKVQVRPFDEAIGLVGSGGIVNAISVIALQWLALHREALRRRWAVAPPAWPPT
jgi:ADP-ribose pyrophosphatase